VHRHDVPLRRLTDVRCGARLLWQRLHRSLDERAALRRVRQRVSERPIMRRRALSGGDVSRRLPDG
jgi:hypothetical protein